MKEGLKPGNAPAKAGKSPCSSPVACWQLCRPSRACSPVPLILCAPPPFWVCVLLAGVVRAAQPTLSDKSRPSPGPHPPCPRVSPSDQRCWQRGRPSNACSAAARCLTDPFPPCSSPTPSPRWRRRRRCATAAPWTGRTPLSAAAPTPRSAAAGRAPPRGTSATSRAPRPSCTPPTPPPPWTSWRRWRRSRPLRPPGLRRSRCGARWGCCRCGSTSCTRSRSIYLRLYRLHCQPKPAAPTQPWMLVRALGVGREPRLAALSVPEPMP